MTNGQLGRNTHRIDPASYASQSCSGHFLSAAILPTCRVVVYQSDASPCDIFQLNPIFYFLFQTGWISLPPICRHLFRFKISKFNLLVCSYIKQVTGANTLHEAD